jgi:alkaline phosphatase
MKSDLGHVLRGILQEQGIPYTVKSAKHHKLEVVLNGKRDVFMASKSAGDKRAAMNLYHQVRRKLEALGHSFVECRHVIC